MPLNAVVVLASRVTQVGDAQRCRSRRCSWLGQKLKILLESGLVGMAHHESEVSLSIHLCLQFENIPRQLELCRPKGPAL